MEKKNYVIGETSQRFLNAMCKYHEFQDCLLDALKGMYGEGDGEKYYLELKDKLDDIERSGIMEYLRISFGLEIGINKQTIEI
jgi:hypothetical protein